MNSNLVPVGFLMLTVGLVGGIALGAWMRMRAGVPCPVCPPAVACGSLPAPGTPPQPGSERPLWAEPLPAGQDYGRSLAEREVRLAPATAREAAKRICRAQQDTIGHGYPEDQGKKVVCYGTGIADNSNRFEELWWELKVDP